MVTSLQTQSNSQPDANVRYAAKAQVIGGIFLTLVSAAVTYVVTLTTNKEEEDRVEPRVTISSADWRDDTKDPGMYRATGKATLRQGQSIYIFSSQVLTDGTTGPLFPEIGPCPTKANGDWECDSGFAGAPKDRGVRFRIFALILDDNHAYETAKKRDGYFGENSGYASVSGTPHVQGVHTAADMDMTRPE
jgi:hypothetical protein